MTEVTRTDIEEVKDVSMRNIDDTYTSINVFGSIKDIIGINILNLNGLIKADSEDNIILVMDNSKENYVVTVDDTDHPIMHVVTFTKEYVHIARYYRNERKEAETPVSERTLSFVDGEISASADEISEDNILSYMFASFGIIKLLEDRDIIKSLKKTGRVGTGVILNVTMDDIQTVVVRGHKRPELPCVVQLPGEEKVITMRPYEDEIRAAEELENMSMDERIAAAENGDTDCMEILMQSYFSGEEVERDLPKAAYWCEKLAETGNISAQYNIGMFYAKGCGLERDFEKAFKWVDKAVMNGNETAQEMALLFGHAAVTLKEAEAGDAKAQAAMVVIYLQVGTMLDDVCGREKETEEAFKWAQKSSEQGDLDGRYFLANLYEQGIGTECDLYKAAEMYREAAEKGHAGSQFKLAMCYINGEGIERDEKRGLYWMYEAAAQGEESAVEMLEREGKSVQQIIELFSDSEIYFLLEDTQYEGRSERCENLRAGSMLTYELITDRNGEDAIECFYNGESVGLVRHHIIDDVISLLQFGRISLAVKVKSCIPKSQRGPKARGADVQLTLIIKEKKPETAEERAGRLETERTAEETARQKEEEERRRAEEEHRRLEEEKRLEEKYKRLEEEKRRIEEEQRRLEEKKLEEEYKRQQEEKKRTEEEQRRLEEEKRLEEKYKRQEEERKRLEEEKRFEEEQRRLEEEKRRAEEERIISEYKEAVKQCEGKREAYINEVVNVYKAEVEAAAKAKFDALLNAAQLCIDQLENEKAVQNAKLDSLGVFSFSAKSECKAAIEKCDKQISEYNRQISNARAEYYVTINTLDSKADKKRKSLYSDAEKEFLMPAKPQAVIEREKREEEEKREKERREREEQKRRRERIAKRFEEKDISLTPEQMNDEEIKEIIYESMEDDTSYTVSEMIENFNFPVNLGEINDMRVFILVLKMYFVEGRLDKSGEEYSKRNKSGAGANNNSVYCLTSVQRDKEVTKAEVLKFLRDEPDRLFEIDELVELFAKNPYLEEISYQKMSQILRSMVINDATAERIEKDPKDHKVYFKAVVI